MQFSTHIAVLPSAAILSPSTILPGAGGREWGEGWGPGWRGIAHFCKQGDRRISGCPTTDLLPSSIYCNHDGGFFASDGVLTCLFGDQDFLTDLSHDPAHGLNGRSKKACPSASVQLCSHRAISFSSARIC